MAWDNITHIIQHDGMVLHGMGQHDTHHDSMNGVVHYGMRHRDTTSLPSIMAWFIMVWHGTTRHTSYSLMAWEYMAHIIQHDGMVHHGIV